MASDADLMNFWQQATLHRLPCTQSLKGLLRKQRSSCQLDFFPVFFVLLNEHQELAISGALTDRWRTPNLTHHTLGDAGSFYFEYVKSFLDFWRTSYPLWWI